MIPLLETALSSLFSGIVNKFFPNKTEIEKQQIIAEMTRDSQQFDLLKGQMEINKVEAASDNLFVSGWRPFIGWVCGSGLAWAWLFCPILDWLVSVVGFAPPVLPSLQTPELIAMVTSLLGLAGYRTYEKVKK